MFLKASTEETKSKTPFSIILISFSFKLAYYYYNNLKALSLANDSIKPIALIHTAKAFALLAFLIAHIYLTTTGETLTSNLQAMITGWETLPATPPPTIPSATVAKDAPSSGCQLPTAKGGSRL